MAIELIYIVCGLIGGIAGLFCIVLFFQRNSKLEKWVGIAIGTGGSTTFLPIVNFITKEANITACVLTFLIGVILGATLFFYGICKGLKASKEPSLRILDLILGQAKFIEEYYNMRIKKINATIDDKIIIEDEKRLEYQRRQLFEQEKALQEQLKDGVVLLLPKNFKMVIDFAFLGQLPDCIDRIAKFISHMNQHTEDIIRKYNSHSKTDNYSTVQAFFLGVCSYIIADLFNGSSHQSVRVHFRRLDGDTYVKLVAQLGSQIYAKDLTPIKKGEGLIQESYILKKSIIKSINLGSEVPCKNDNIWEDYMTITFAAPLKTDEPFISMGISVKNREKYKYLMYFLNFYKIENLLQEHIDMIDEKYNIVETIEYGVGKGL